MPQIPVNNPDISQQEKTYLASAVSVDGTGLTVADYSGLSNNDYLVLGPYGKEKSEIVQIGDDNILTSFELTAALKYAHPANTVVQVMLFNEFELGSATTETGTFSDVGTAVIQPDSLQTVYNDTSGASTTWYRVRYYNDTTTSYSDYSDAVQATGYKTNSRGRLKELAVSMFGDKNEQWISNSDWDNFFLQTEQEVFVNRKKWNFLQSETAFELLEGKSEYDLSTYVPTLKENSESYIDSVWIEDNDPLKYNDKKEFNRLREGAQFTKLSGDLAASGTTAEVVDASMLDTAGTIYIAGDEIDLASVSGTTLTISNVDSAHSAGDEVWMVGELGEPAERTTWGDNLTINPTPDTAYVCHIDHYKDGVPMDEDNDVSEIPRSTKLLLDGVLSLAWQVRQDEKMYLQKRAEFENGLRELGYQERLGQKQSLTPSDEEGYVEGKDYTDFDLGNLRFISDKYRT